jgi:hypothetical protein
MSQFFSAARPQPSGGPPRWFQKCSSKRSQTRGTSQYRTEQNRTERAEGNRGKGGPSTAEPNAGIETGMERGKGGQSAGTRSGAAAASAAAAAAAAVAASAAAAAATAAWTNSLIFRRGLQMSMGEGGGGAGGVEGTGIGYFNTSAYKSLPDIAATSLRLHPTFAAFSHLATATRPSPPPRGFRNVAAR